MDLHTYKMAVGMAGGLAGGLACETAVRPDVGWTNEKESWRKEGRMACDGQSSEQAVWSATI